MNQIQRHLEALLLRQRGNNYSLVLELRKLTPAAQRRLWEVLKGLEDEASSERCKRKQGRFW